MSRRPEAPRDRTDPVEPPPRRGEGDDPLRGLAKSMMRCGWAMGLMGWEAALGSAPGATEARRRRFEDAAHAAERELGEHLGAVYRAGVRAGDRMIDGMAELGAGTPLDPRRLARTIAGLAEQAGETLETMAGRPARRRRHGPEYAAADRRPVDDPESGGWP